MNPINKILGKFKTSLSERIAEAVIAENQIMWTEREQSLLREKETELSNQKKIDDHRNAHLKNEMRERIRKLNAAHAEEISRLSDKVRSLNTQLEVQKKHSRRVAQSMAEREKSAAIKVAEADYLSMRLKKWIEGFSSELVRIQHVKNFEAEKQEYIVGLKELISERIK